MELKPCPFCGGHGILKDRFIAGIANTKHYWIVCGECQTKMIERRSMVRAETAWNTRKGES